MPTSQIEPAHRSGFEETRWSVVLRAKRSDETSEEALETLCNTYRLPLYSFARRRGFHSADAEDVVQEFLTALIHRNRLQTVDPAKGRFRAFLLAAFKNFLASEWDSRRALKRGGAFHFVSLHDPHLESLYCGLTAPREDDDRFFDRGWALAIVHSAMTQLASEYEQQGRRPLFDAAKSCLSVNGKTFEYEAVALDLRMREDALRMAVNRMRRRFGVLLRLQVRETVPDPKDAEDELKYLLSCL